MNELCARIALAQDGDAEEEQALVADNLPLVYALVRRFSGRGVEVDDLVQLGSLGLLKAIRKFDFSYEVCFSTYAVPLIIGEIKRFLRDDGPVKVSRSLRTLAVQAGRLTREQPELNVDTLSSLLACSREELAMALSSQDAVLSIDAQADTGSVTLLDTLGGMETETPTVNRLLIQELMCSLPERERLILDLRFFQDKTQTEVASRLGISQVQVSRIEKKTLLLLRERAS